MVGLAVEIDVDGIGLELIVGAWVGKADTTPGTVVATVSFKKLPTTGSIIGTFTTISKQGNSDPSASTISSPFTAFPITSIRLEVDFSSFKYKSKMRM